MVYCNYSKMEEQHDGLVMKKEVKAAWGFYPLSYCTNTNKTQLMWTYCAERPAWATLALVLDGCYVAHCPPVHSIREISEQHWRQVGGAIAGLLCLLVAIHLHTDFKYILQPSQNSEVKWKLNANEKRNDWCWKMDVPYLSIHWFLVYICTSLTLV